MFRKILIVVFVSGLLFSGCDRKSSIEERNNISPAPEQQVSSTVKDRQKIVYHLGRGMSLKAQGEYEEAIREFKQAIEAGDDDKETYRKIAESYYSLKNYNECKKYLKIVIEKDPEDAMAHWALAKMLIRDLKEYEEGLREAILSKKLYGEDGTSYVHDLAIAQAYDGLGDYENALKHYKVFLKKSPARYADDYKQTKRRVKEIEEELKKRE